MTLPPIDPAVHMPGVYARLFNGRNKEVYVDESLDIAVRQYGNKKTKGHENDTWRKNSDGSYSEKGEHYTFARRCFNENKGLKAHVVLLCYMKKKKETINIVENLFARFLFAYSNFALSSSLTRHNE